MGVRGYFYDYPITGFVYIRGSGVERITRTY